MDNRSSPCATVPALDYCRAILMSAKNRHYLSLLECGKPQLYGRAVDTVQALTPKSPSGCRLEKLHFNQDGIKGGGVAQVRKFF